MNTRILLAAMAALTLTTAAHAGAVDRHSEVTQFCGDRYGASPGRATGGRPTRQTAPGRHLGSRDRAPRRLAQRAVTHGGLGTVSTAAGIDITVADDFAPAIQGFISDVVASGYHPHQIHCYATGGHVHGSLHYSGHACDFDQSGWGRTAKAMYHVAALAAKWGLRDGGEFRDWGHIDNGPHLHRGSRAARLAANPPFYGATSTYVARHRVHLAHRQ